jgi:hypothetical protein
MALGAQAQVNYPFDTNNSSVTITHIADTSNTSFPPTVVTEPGANIKQTATTFMNNDVISTTTRTGVSSTNATAGLYHSNSSTDMTIAVTGGTGVGQANVPGEAFSGPSELDVNIDALWTLNSAYSPANQFPGINYQFPLGGVIGIGGTDHFIVSLTFYDTTFTPGSGAKVQTPIGSLNIDMAMTNTSSAPLPFTQTLSGDDLINNGNALPVGSEFEEVGDIIFKSKNDESPSSFDFTDDTNTGAETYTTEPTGAQDFSFISATNVPLPSSVAMGFLAIGLMGLGRVVKSARRSAGSTL